MTAKTMLRCAASQANLYLRIIGSKYGGETLVYGVINDKTIQPAQFWVAVLAIDSLLKLNDDDHRVFHPSEVLQTEPSVTCRL